MGLRLGISNKQELFLLKELAKGNVEFEDLNPMNQMLLYRSDIDISDRVPEEQIKQFEEEHVLEGQATSRIDAVQMAVNRFMNRNLTAEEAE